MAFIDTVLVFAIFTTLILLAWSRIMDQKVIDCLREIRDFIQETKEVPVV